MRLYVPVTLDELDTAAVAAHGARWHLRPRGAHAVTPALVTGLADEDDEGREYAAFLAAADDSLGLVAAASDPVPPLRAVLSLEVPDDVVAPGTPSPAGGPVAPSAVQVTRELPDAALVAIHADEPAAEADVLAVLAAVDADDDAALDEAVQRVTDRDLLWYAPSEAHDVPRGRGDQPR
ncbi:DUF6912 family protein [Isoptericola aurantiacus]|uniref:DUF6912 family protein n=1 Tax=Isoptericola aurantiacus TaxID=3377839 RepID=UPI00383B8DC4